jgi:GNAT superfamily N-acetyltransferase
MGATEALRQASLDEADIAASLALSAAVGWNQTAEDWRIFLAAGNAIGLFDAGDRLVATAATLPYGADFGWISMVIVAPAWRRQGLAQRLMGECIARLEGAGRAALLDATPAGAAVYAGLGFAALTEMERWEGEGVRGAADPRVGTADLDALVAADAAAFGTDRRFLLGNFLARDGGAALACDDAYLVMRRGLRATQLGPLIARSPAPAERLLAAAIGMTTGPIFLDLFTGWSRLGALLAAKGFRRQRPFRRMALGRSDLPGDATRLALAAGPEFG